MSDSMFTWLAAIIAGSILSKLFGLILRSRDPGVVLGPILGVAGAAAGWGIFSNVTGHAPDDWIAAAMAGAIGGALFYLAGVRIKAARTLPASNEPRNRR